MCTYVCYYQVIMYYVVRGRKGKRKLCLTASPGGVPTPNKARSGGAAMPERERHARRWVEQEVLRFVPCSRVVVYFVCCSCTRGARCGQLSQVCERLPRCRIGHLRKRAGDVSGCLAMRVRAGADDKLSRGIACPGNHSWAECRQRRAPHSMIMIRLKLQLRRAGLGERRAGATASTQASPDMKTTNIVELADTASACRLTKASCALACGSARQQSQAQGAPPKCDVAVDLNCSVHGQRDLLAARERRQTCYHSFRRLLDFDSAHYRGCRRDFPHPEEERQRGGCHQPPQQAATVLLLLLRRGRTMRWIVPDPQRRMSERRREQQWRIAGTAERPTEPAHLG